MIEQLMTTSWSCSLRPTTRNVLFCWWWKICTLLSPDELPEGIHFFWPSSYTITDARAPIMLCSHIFLAAAAVAVPAPFCEIPGVAVAFVAATAAHTFFLFYSLFYVLCSFLLTRLRLRRRRRRFCTRGQMVVLLLLLLLMMLLLHTAAHSQTHVYVVHTKLFPHTHSYMRLLIPAATHCLSCFVNSKIRRFLLSSSVFTSVSSLRILAICRFTFLAD